MTDRQIEVLEKAHKMLFDSQGDYMQSNGFQGFLYELELIIKEQKELNLKEFKDKK